MSTFTATHDSGTTRATLPFGTALLAVALLAGVGGVLGLNTVLASLASPVEAPAAAPAARPRTVTYTDSSVPDAGSVLAGQADRIEEPAPTF